MSDTDDYIANRTEGEAGAPLVLTFHGTGGDEHQFHDFARELIPGAHVVSPRGDVSEGGAARYFRRKAEGVYDMDDLARATGKMANLIAAEEARTGATRVCALGYSNGANILAAVLLKHPSLVHEAALMHPLIPWEPAPQPGLGRHRILVTAGEADPICPAPETRRLLDYLSAQGADVTPFWHGGGHEIRREEIAAVREFFAGDGA